VLWLLICYGRKIGSYLSCLGWIDRRCKCSNSQQLLVSNFWQKWQSIDSHGSPLTPMTVYYANDTYWHQWHFTDADGGPLMPLTIYWQQWRDSDANDGLLRQWHFTNTNDTLLALMTGHCHQWHFTDAINSLLTAMTVLWRQWRRLWCTIWPKFLRFADTLVHSLRENTSIRSRVPEKS